MGKGTIAFLILLTLCACNTYAAFVSQHDTFPGTSPDTANWQAYPAFAFGFSQNNGLTIDTTSAGGPYIADYTTTSLQVPVGGSAWTRFTMLAAGNPSSGNPEQGALFLTTNNNGVSLPDQYDSYYLMLGMSTDGIWFNSAGFAQLQPAPPSLLGRQFTLQITRTTDSITDYYVFDDTGLIASQQINWPGLAAPLYISVQSSSSKVLFHEVWIPEPATATLLTLGAALMIIPRRRSSRSARP